MAFAIVPGALETWSRQATEAEWTAASKPWPPLAAQSTWPSAVTAELRTAVEDKTRLPFGKVKLRTWGAEVEGEPSVWTIYAQRVG